MSDMRNQDTSRFRCDGSVAAIAAATKAQLQRQEFGDSCLGKRSRAGSVRRNWSLDSNSGNDESAGDPTPTIEYYSRNQSNQQSNRFDTPNRFDAPILFASDSSKHGIMDGGFVLPPPQPSNFRRDPIHRFALWPPNDSPTFDRLKTTDGWGWFVETD